MKIKVVVNDINFDVDSLELPLREAKSFTNRFTDTLISITLLNAVMSYAARHNLAT